MPKAINQEQADRCMTPVRDLLKGEYQSAFRWKSKRIDSAIAAKAMLLISEDMSLSIDQAVALASGAGSDATPATDRDDIEPEEPETAEATEPERHEPAVVAERPRHVDVGPAGVDVELEFVDFDQIPRDTTPHGGKHTLYEDVAVQLKRHAGHWACIKRFDPTPGREWASRRQARQMSQRIRTGELAAFRPKGRFDAVTTTPERGGPTLVYATCHPIEA